MSNNLRVFESGVGGDAIASASNLCTSMHLRQPEMVKRQLKHVNCRCCSVTLPCMPSENLYANLLLAGADSQKGKPDTLAVLHHSVILVWRIVQRVVRRCVPKALAEYIAAGPPQQAALLLRG